MGKLQQLCAGRRIFWSNMRDVYHQQSYSWPLESQLKHVTRHCFGRPNVTTARLDDMLARPSQIGHFTYCSVPANPLAMQSCLDPT